MQEFSIFDMSVEREKYMRRALQLARLGEGFVSPNPMVGAVIVCNGKIIGEGFHRMWGEAHAEVNAINSVVDKSLLAQSTLYVTLEPCSHYGKTPPCAKLIIDSGIPKVIIGSTDPFEKVAGRGIKLLQDAGIDVRTGVLQHDCDMLNKTFMYAHRNQRPYILLKWAQSSDGFIAGENGTPIKFSNPLSTISMHRERSLYDAILVGTNTVITDNPTLTTRYWSGRNPKKISFDIHGNLPQNSILARDLNSIIITENKSLHEIVSELYSSHNITSLMVEGGQKTLSSFIEADLWNEIRIEISPQNINKGIKAPLINSENFLIKEVRNNKILLKRR